MSLQEYMAFMISRETENVQSSSDVEQAFRALTSGDKPYITAQELYAVRTSRSVMDSNIFISASLITNCKLFLRKVSFM